MLYCKKEEAVQAWQLDVDSERPKWLTNTMQLEHTIVGAVRPAHEAFPDKYTPGSPHLVVRTGPGKDIVVRPSDWIIKNRNDTLVVCNNENFQKIFCTLNIEVKE